jgi:Na+-transporting NADH:ubiquinone oxidoreductase subunit C
VCGGLLALAAEGLKERQQTNVALEQRKNILSTVMEIKEGDDVNALYKKNVQEYVVDYSGDIVEGVDPSKVNLTAEWKKTAESRMLPVYEFRNATSNAVEYVVLPVYGYGLWNEIWGFVALQSDFNTVQGVKFEHKGETPGLGARITESEVQARFKDKSIFDQQVITSIQMMKGEGNDYSNQPHKVDGMSGATLTGKGVNNMLLDYFKCYQNYLNKNRTK